MPTKEQHTDNISFQLELQEFEVKLIDDIVLLEERSVLIGISIEALKESSYIQVTTTYLQATRKFSVTLN